MKTDIRSKLSDLLLFDEIKNDVILGDLLESLINAFIIRQDGKTIESFPIITTHEIKSVRGSIVRRITNETDVDKKTAHSILIDNKDLVDLKILINSVKKQVDSIRLYGFNSPKLEFNTRNKYKLHKNITL